MKRRTTIDRGVVAAVGAAVLFGFSTPLAKPLVGQISPLLLAGLLYLGSGIGLATLLVMRSARGGRAAMTSSPRCWRGSSSEKTSIAELPSASG